MSTMSTIKFPGDTVAREIVDKLARVNIGNLNALNTEDKISLVAAINELSRRIDAGDIGGDDEESAAKADFIDLGEEICPYTLEELQTFVDEQRILIGVWGGIHLPLIQISSERALFSASFEGLGSFQMMEGIVFADQSMDWNLYSYPKVPVPDDDEAGFFLQADNNYNARWVKSSATVEVDKTLSLPNTAAAAESVGNALSAISNISKVTNIDLSEWDNGSFSTTLLNGAVINFTVTFNANKIPTAITDDNGVTTTIVWPD